MDEIEKGTPSRRECVHVAEMVQGDASAVNQPDDELLQVEFELSKERRWAPLFNGDSPWV